MDERLDLWDSEELYKKCKQFCDTWEFGKECNNRKGMYDFLEGIEMDLYNQKKMVLCIGQGQWEDEGRVTTARLRDIFAEKGIHAWVDFWGYDVDHDWPWWKKQIVYFLPYLMGER